MTSPQPAIPQTGPPPPILQTGKIGAAREVDGRRDHLEQMMQWAEQETLRRQAALDNTTYVLLWGARPVPTPTQLGKNAQQLRSWTKGQSDYYLNPQRHKAPHVDTTANRDGDVAEVVSFDLLNSRIQASREHAATLDDWVKERDATKTAHATEIEDRITKAYDDPPLAELEKLRKNHAVKAKNMGFWKNWWWAGRLKGKNPFVALAVGVAVVCVLPFAFPAIVGAVIGTAIPAGIGVAVSALVTAGWAGGAIAYGASQKAKTWEPLETARGLKIMPQTLDREIKLRNDPVLQQRIKNEIANAVAQECTRIDNIHYKQVTERCEQFRQRFENGDLVGDGLVTTVAGQQISVTYINEPFKAVLGAEGELIKAQEAQWRGLNGNNEIAALLLAGGEVSTPGSGTAHATTKSVADVMAQLTDPRTGSAALKTLTDNRKISLNDGSTFVLPSEANGDAAWGVLNTNVTTLTGPSLSSGLSMP